MICYFREGLKPFIKVEMEQQNRECIDFKEMVQRAVNAEAKAGLKFSTMIRESDGCYPRGHRPSHNTSAKVQPQGTTAKEPRSKEPKPKDSKQAPSRDDTAEPAKKEDRKEKKKKLRNRRREHTGEQTPTIGVNTEAPKKKLKIRCFNYNKKGHYANECTEPRHEPSKN